MRKFELIFLFLICIGIASFLPNSVFALVDGPCSICHTMHNSQGGESMEPGGGDEPFPSLTRGTCIGCHTGTNNGGDIPYVMSSGEPNYSTDTLAGGNFWWVATDGEGNDTKGHNVLGLSNQDINIPAGTGAPGGWVTCSNTCHMTLAAKQTVIPELGSGCEGCHLAPAHHANDSDVVVGSNPANRGGWFRYCSGHMSGSGHGVEGIEDTDWQYTNSMSDHNEYLGHEANLASNAGFYNLGNTMSAYCCGCHGGFHDEENGGGAWIRHPSDALIPSSGEYLNYTVYDPLTPVARPSLDGWTAPISDVRPGTDLVMCLSCHRAHGSPYPDMLRWDYNSQVAGGGGEDTGCFKCHSLKN